jgi:hypothetical protein
MLLLMSVLYVQQAAAQKQQHREYRETKIAECNACHKAEGIAPNHDSDWVRSHRSVAGKSGSNCAQCHDQSYCLDCHKGGGINADLSAETAGRDFAPRSHRSDFITLHSLKAQDNPQTCYRCHDQKYCSQCHDRFPKGSLRIKSHLMLGPDHQKYAPAINEHATEARRNLQSCATCHPDGDVCIQCHASGKVRPHPRNWRSDTMKDRSGGRVCLKCHLPGTY